MIEYLLLPAAMAVAAAMPKGKTNDKKKIQTIFKNAKFGIPMDKGKLELPRLKRREPIYEKVYLENGKEKTHFTKEEKKQLTILGYTYIYNVPLGLASSKVAPLLFTDGLQKPVEVEFNRKIGLMIRVFNEDLPEFFSFAERDKETGKLQLLVPERKDDFWVPMGKAVDGMIWHNFTHTPHATGAGTTRFGKSVWLRMVMTYLILMHGDNVEFYVIDLKGGLEFGRYRSIRQVKEVAGNASEALDLLTYITNDDEEKGPLGLLEQQYLRYRKNNWSNTVEAKEKKRRFIIVDEGAQLAPQKLMSKAEAGVMIDCQTKLAKIAGVAGGLGISIIFTTQYPVADTMPRLIKQNADAKVSFRLPTGYASEVAIDEHGAEKLPSDFKGRALYKTHMLKEFQAPFLDHKDMWELLSKYQIPIPLEGVPENVIDGEETQTGRTDSHELGAALVRNQGTASADSYVRFEP